MLRRMLGFDVYRKVVKQYLPRVILGLYRGYIGVMLGLYRGNGRENGNYYYGLHPAFWQLYTRNLKNLRSP